MPSDAPENWFEDIYARSDTSGRGVPWDRQTPSPLLVSWLDGQPAPPVGARALVVGCGLGDDAAELDRRGWAVTAFDVAASAIDLCRERWAGRPIGWHVQELFALPARWTGAFDLVVEHRTIQSLPVAWQARGMAAVSRTVAAGGTLVVICDLRPAGTEPVGPPWRLRPGELEAFATAGLAEQARHLQSAGGDRAHERLRVVYRHEGPGPDRTDDLA
jgi:SAM-dependent methyltransferase